MAVTSVRDGSLDSLSCYTFTLINDDSSELAGTCIANAENEWYQKLPVTQLVEVSLVQHRNNASRSFVLLLSDSSAYCLGPDDGSASSGGKTTWHPLPRLLSSDDLSTTLAKLSFSDRPRDLIEVLRIWQCVQSRLNLEHAASDLVCLLTLIVFARTFCRWEESITGHGEWNDILRDAIPIAESVDEMPRPVSQKRSSLSARPSPMTNKQVHIAQGLREALAAELDSVKGTMAGACLQEKLEDEISSKLMASVRDSARASAILSATAAAQSAARVAIQKLRKERLYDAAWEFSLDVGDLEADTISGRARLSFTADHLSIRGLPRSEHAEAVRVLSESVPDSARSGWTTGCSAGWTLGWRAGRRAATLFDWKAFQEDFPLEPWCDDQDIEWDEVWDRASASDRTLTGPYISLENSGRSEYNAAWDSGWETGWGEGYDVGRESGREGAKRMAVKEWRIARLGAENAGYTVLWDKLTQWCEGVPLGPVPCYLPREDFRAQRGRLRLKGAGCTAQERWEEALSMTWDQYGRSGAVDLATACANIGQTCADYAHKVAYTPAVRFSCSTGLGNAVVGDRLCAHYELEAYLMSLVNLNHAHAFLMGSKDKKLFVSDILQDVWRNISRVVVSK
ncbi:hypothetical protein RhiJN_25043 [Ceratobasidium sp. AG-Ba]|nr:hypothetical protein RhiJN_25043 [Ceratobasidium sp. AG-Ba]